MPFAYGSAEGLNDTAGLLGGRPQAELFQPVAVADSLFDVGFGRLFDVGFGLQSGYAHVIEDEAEWKVDFGRNVLEGILEHPDGGIPLARRRKPAPDALREAVADFTKRFEPFDWTRQLEGG